MNQLREMQGDDGIFRVHPDARVDPGARIGAGSVVWAGAHIFSGARIGSNCVIGEGVGIENDTLLGEGCKVQSGVRLYAGVEAGDFVFFGPNATTTNDRNPRAFGEWRLSRTIIETGASIGANATLIAGNTIGALALIGSGSVVTRDVEAASLVVGSPAKRVGWVDVSGKVVSDEARRPDHIQAAVDDPRRAIRQYLLSLDNKS